MVNRMKKTINCPECGGDGEVEDRYYWIICPGCKGSGKVIIDIKTVEEKYPYLNAVLCDPACRMSLTWSFDEQQAEPIHNNFSIICKSL